MKTLTTLGDVAKQVNEYALDCRDEVVPVRELSFNSIDSINIGRETHPVMLMGQRSMAYRLNVPLQYISRCPEELQKGHLDYWLQSVPNSTLLFRFKGDAVRAIFTEKYIPLDNTIVLNQLFQAGYTDETPVQFSMDDDFFSLSIPDTERAFKANKDEYQSGINIRNGETGLSSLSVSAFLLRLICTNGMITRTEKTASYRHVSHKAFDEFPEILKTVSVNINTMKHQFRLAADSPVENLEETIKSFSRQFQMNEKEQEAVMWGLRQEELGPTMYAIVNAFTAGAKYDLPAESQNRLQRFGGNILALLN